jgi:citronellol/citronellal dehydrogenase
MSLQGKRIFVTGGSRGIGLSLSLSELLVMAPLSAIAAKTSDPNPKLPGTHSHCSRRYPCSAGTALPIQCDLRDENQIANAVALAAKEFGGIDILINNASAINLTRTEDTPAKRFDLMFDVNVRGTFLASQAAIPFLRESAEAGRNPHILTLSPPLSMKAKWFKNHVAYTMAKYGMSMCVLAYIRGVQARWNRSQRTLATNCN